MPDEDDIAVDDTDSTPAPTKKSPDPVPYSRFREVVQQRRDLEGKLAAAEAALSAAETDKLAAVKKYDELQEATKVAAQDLEGKLAVQTADMDKYKALMASIVDDTTKEWPDEIKVFDPGADADPLVRLEWARKAELLVAKINGSSGTAGTGPKPAPKQSAVDPKQIQPAVDVRRRF